jgi:hypothetical protein
VTDQSNDSESGAFSAHHTLVPQVDDVELVNSESNHKNGNGRVIRVPWAASAIFLAAVAYTVTVVIWGARLQSHVEELERLLRQAETVDGARTKDLFNRLDALDIAGPRALAPLTLRTTQMETSISVQGRQIEGLEQGYNSLSRELAVTKDRQDRGIADMQRLESQLRELRQKTQ